jgi:hypothetical protein
MRPSRLLGLLATTLVAGAALVAPSSSSATVLCEIGANNYCPATAIFPANTSFSGALAPATKAKFKTSVGTVECTGSTIEGETTEKEAEPLPGNISALTFTSCKFGTTACTITTENLPYTAELVATGEGSGALTISSEETSFATVKCGFLINCTYSANVETEAKGGEPTEVIATEAPITSISGLCPKTNSFSATYQLNAPNEGFAFVSTAAAVNTLLCSAIPETTMAGNLKCQVGTVYAGELKGELAAGITEFYSVNEPAKKVTCNETAYSGQFKNDGDPANVMGGINTLTFTSLVGGMPGKPCSSTFEAGNPSVKVTVERLPYAQSVFKYDQAGNPQGSFDFPAAPVEIKYEIQVAGVPTCKYTSARIWGKEFNGAGTNPSLLLMLGTFAKVAGGAAACPPDLRLQSNVTMKGAAGNAYIARE